MVSSIETIVPGTPVNCSATAKGCDKKHAENKEEYRYQRITAEIVVREHRIINPSAYAAHQYR